MVIYTTDSLTAEDLDVARTVLAAAAAADGREAVSEAGRLRLRADAPRPGVLHLVQTLDSRPAGYAQLEASAAESAATVELAVHPELRRRGLGRHLLDAVLEEAGPQRTVDFWAHGGHPGAVRLAAEYGAELIRELRQMRRTAPAPEQAPLPEGVTVRAFRPGQDDEAWLRLNALAFAHHPEQGSWTTQDLADRLAEPWFDPNGFFLAFRNDRLVGFHWTKVHPATATEPELGEVYVVGVDPAEQGNGLGRALTTVGLRHLALDRGLDTVLLYVDADNTAAVRVYERVGFVVHEVDLMYQVKRGS
ncbi:mycothiol synthase [Kitasatospora acidiphila]|uniref:Mycothiol acetyltransferase n=1 Tax=Kitasatospora acidiphila TaxID=2567942 RepID=A0A540W4R5_9ACTN|nr:mycothiol synthase [Kitasatospora acidiphila]TQF03990.1 mycothiol synthase [Kitasatospora acidiphila]